MRVEVCVGDQVVAYGERRGDGVVHRAKAGDNVIDEFVVTDGSSGRGHGIGESFHLVHVGRCCELLLPG